MKLVLPWPPAVLSPNARPHFMVLAKAKKRYRSACAMVARTQGARRIEADRLKVHLTFVPPDRRTRDDQNLIGSMKAGLDGLADVLGVDDSRWHVTHDPYSTADIGGMVKVEVTSC